MPADIKHNIPEFRREFAKLGDRFVRGPLLDGVRDFVGIYLKRVRRRGYGFRDRSGKLRRSIKDYGYTIHSGGITWTVGTDHAYAARTEYRRDGRYSYVRRAANELRSQYVPTLDKRIRAWLERQPR